MMPEIGDKFIINWKKIRSTYPNVKSCKFTHSEFTIKAFSNSRLSVYFTDNRTNTNCFCQICKKFTSIGVSDIIITQRNLAIERDKKLKELGI